MCTNDLIVLHPLGIFILFFSFLVRKIPFAGIELTSQRARGLRGTSELPGRPAYIVLMYYHSSVDSVDSLASITRVGFSLESVEKANT